MSRATQERKFPVGKPQLRIQHTVSQHIYVMPVSARSYEVDIWNLNTQIALIRNSLLHLSQQRDVRTEFLDERTKQIESSWDRLARTKPELFGPFKDIHKSFAKSESKWLRENILAIVEFSEHRINQMELVVRCALFEAVLTDVVGNILWEYPQRSKNAIHDSFDAPKKRHPNEKEEDFRGRRIEALVERVNHLSY